MKTKIIYISGNEVFEMSEIRAAFDEVRSALGLDNDTILFGVPVDSDNALETPNTVTKAAEQTTCVVTEEIETSETMEPVSEIEEIPETPICEEVIEIPQDIIDNEVSEEAHAPTNEIVEAPSAEIENEEKIIPILSVLAVNTNEAPTENNLTEVFYNKHDAEEDLTTTPTVHVAEPKEDVVEPIAEVDNVEKITLGAVEDDESPIEATEKSIFNLLESMAPLREDIEHNISDYAEMDTIDTFDMDTNDTDATLAQLASEFVENEDKITTNMNTEPQGKISKLKNILPFKKAKRDDGSLMGDLFGWAGIAANDDDFTMPGFFTGAKKQGA